VVLLRLCGRVFAFRRVGNAVVSRPLPARAPARNAKAQALDQRPLLKLLRGE
jgi:hypothetical protein